MFQQCLLEKIVETAPIDKIFSEPKHPYTRALIDAMPPVTLEEELIRKLGLKIKPGNPSSLSNPPSGCRFHPRCPFATEKCRKEEPKSEPVVISENHVVYCHLFS